MNIFFSFSEKRFPFFFFAEGGVSRNFREGPWSHQVCLRKNLQETSMLKPFPQNVRSWLLFFPLGPVAEHCLAGKHTVAGSNDPV